MGEQGSQVSSGVEFPCPWELSQAPRFIFEEKTAGSNKQVDGFWNQEP